MTTPPDTVISNPSARRAEAYCPECGQSYPPDHEHCPNDAARLVKLAQPVDPLVGRVFEQRYEIRSRLGEGGMGAVYRGWQLSVDREVAIKVIDPRLSGNRAVVKRFLREARLSSRLNLPAIVNVYDFGQTEDGILYIVMELLRGHTLASELAARQPIGLERAVHIAVQLCDALDAAHSQGIIHRDLKPGNVMILDDPPGRDLVKVLDFGLAKSLGHDPASKVTRSDAMLGTPLYMSPEQIAGQPADPRVDLYSLGCMLHEMVSGAPPFGGPTVDRVLSNHLYELAAPLPPEVPEPLAELIASLIAKHPADRPPTAAQVRRALLGDPGRAGTFGTDVTIGSGSSPAVPRRATVTPQPTTESPPPGSALPRARAGIGPRRWIVAVAALLALGGIAAAIAITQRWHDAQPAGGATRDAAAPDAASDAEPDPRDTTAPPIDAGAPPADAARPADARPPPRRRPAPAPPVPGADAGAELDFYPSTPRP